MKFLYEIYIPSCLFDSADSTNGFEELSEQIAKSLLVHKLKISNEKLIKRGNEKNKEPDYIINDIGYEVTFALSNMLIKQFKGIMPLTAVNEFNEDSMIQQIKHSLQKKAIKKYSIQTIPVIFSLLPNVFWDTDIEESTVTCLDDIEDFVLAGLWKSQQIKRDDLFIQLYDTYIKKNIFTDIYIVNFTRDNRYVLYSILDFYQKKKYRTLFGITNNQLLPYCRLLEKDRGENFEPIQNFYKIRFGKINRVPHNKM